MKRILPLTLTLMLLFAGCTRTPDTPCAPPSIEPTAETGELPLDLQNAGVDAPLESPSIEPTLDSVKDERDGPLNSDPTAPAVEPTSEKPEDEDARTRSTARPESTVKSTLKPQHASSPSTPSAALAIVAPTLEPESTPKPTAKLTVKPTQKPAPSPKPPQPTEASTSGYTDATHLCAAFMDAINTEKETNGAAFGSLDPGLCGIAQDRARQMAEVCKASHIGSGYAETVGAMGSENGATNRGRNSVHQSPQLMDCTSCGIGVAIGSDGMYYYSIIGE